MASSKMTRSIGQNRPIRIANISGATGDYPNAMKRMALNEEIDAITGDFLSEMNISWNSIEMKSDATSGYDKGFLRQFEDSVDIIASKGIKVVTNAGGLNPNQLAKEVKAILKAKGYGLQVATVVGDNITDQLQNHQFYHLDSGAPLNSWDKAAEVGVAYIGCRAIVSALNANADIVICGRVTDASPVIGLAAWWFQWDLDRDFDQLAGGLIAGHLIECGPYLTGANFSGFKKHLDQLVNLAFPIAEISSNGDTVVTKQHDCNGFVEVDNVTAQLLYELQGELYLNPDVTADIGTVQLQQVGPNRVLVTGTKGTPPPSTTKAIISGVGGYQAQALFFINGLDISEKITMMKNQLQSAFSKSNFNKLSISVIGSPEQNPSKQSAGTCILRVFAQSPTKAGIDMHHFKQLIYAIRMQSYPGYHMDLDFRMMDPKMFMELWPTTIPQSSLKQAVVLNDDRVLSVTPPLQFQDVARVRPSYETSNPVELDSFGETVEAPLGYIVHARSGDKADNSNVGLFVRHEDEYPWLQSLLTIEKFKSLLGDEISGQRIERCEFPHLKAVHFRVLDFLDGGIASSSRIDGLGKGVGEFIRSRYVSIPKRFLDRGKI